MVEAADAEVTTKVLFIGELKFCYEDDSLMPQRCKLARLLVQYELITEDLVHIISMYYGYLREKYRKVYPGEEVEESLYETESDLRNSVAESETSLMASMGLPITFVCAVAIM